MRIRPVWLWFVPPVAVVLVLVSYCTILLVQSPKLTRECQARCAPEPVAEITHVSVWGGVCECQVESKTMDLRQRREIRW